MMVEGVNRLAKKDDDNKVARVLGLKNQVSSEDLSPNSLILNEIDRDIFHDCVERYPAMQENLEAGLKEYAPFDHLSEDIFNSLFKFNAKLHDEEDVKAFSKFNHGIMEEMLESEDYEKLRKNTKFDAMSSSIGTEVLQNKAMEKIQYFKEQYKKQQQTGQPQDGADAGKLIDQMNAAKGTSDAISNLIGSVPGGVDGMSPKQAQQLAALQQQLKKQEKEIDANINGQEEFTDGMTEEIDNAAAAANEVVGEVRDIVQAWGLETGQSNRRISLEKRRKSIERVRRSKRLKDLTDLIGRFRAIATQTKKQKIKNGHSIKSVTVGNHVESIIPSEWAKLAHPVLQKDFIKRFHEKQLFQYYKEDTRTKGRGPVVLCHDKSWSMEENEGAKDDWATALALATLEVAQKDKRNFAYIPYNGGVMDKMVKDIPAGELDPDDIMDIAELSPYGGTDFESPLRKAMEFLDSSSYKKGDIVFVTDGDCGVSDQFVKEFKALKEQKQFFVHSVVINIGHSGASRGTVDLFSDHVTTISSIADLDEANAAKIFNLVEDSAAMSAAHADMGDDGDATDDMDDVV